MDRQDLAVAIVAACLCLMSIVVSWTGLSCSACA